MCTYTILLVTKEIFVKEMFCYLLGHTDLKPNEFLKMVINLKVNKPLV